MTTPPNPSSVYPTAQNNYKILLVDDEEEFVNALRERLEARNLDSLVAYDGENALLIADKEEPHVMLLDLKMPGMSGVDVLKKMKISHPNTEIVILTGHGSEADRDLVLQMGALVYYQKPTNIETLAATIVGACEKASRPQVIIDHKGMQDG